MNKTELIALVADKAGSTQVQAEAIINAFADVVTETLAERKEKVVVTGFGTFEVKKKMERISVNPSTQQRMLIPPKLVLTYKPSITLKEKFK